MLLILVLGTSLMGIASSIQEIVKERVIYQRERSVGLPPGAYLASKFLLLSAISVFQTTVFFIVTMLGRSLGDEPLTAAVFDILVPCAVLGIAAVALGLLASAAIDSVDQAMPILVLATMVLVVLSGALTLRYTGLLEWAQYAVPSYWAHNALASLFHVGCDRLGGVSGLPVSMGGPGRGVVTARPWPGGVCRGPRVGRGGAGGQAKAARIRWNPSAIFVHAVGSRCA